MNAEFFEAIDAGDKSMNVSSTGFSGAGRLGDKKPLNAASKNAASKWIRIARKQRPENHPGILFVISQPVRIVRLGEDNVEPSSWKQ